MTRPKRWFLVQDTDSTIVIKNTEGLIKKPNASRPLGKVVEVSGDTEYTAVTRPKRWFLVQDTDSTIVSKNTEGLIKKPNASRPLGKVVR